MTTKADMRKFQAAMDRVLKDVSSPAAMREIGNEAADRIRKRTRLGKGVAAPGADPIPLKPLSDSYKDARKKQRGNKGKLSSFTSAGKSNLTFTGQMLDSLRVLTQSASSVVIGLYGNRKGGGSNSEVGGFVSEVRPFLNLSKAEMNGLARIIRERIDAALKRFLT